MPEGDTIRRLAAEFRARVVGRTVTGSIFRHPRLATLDVRGSTLVDATSHGKHLFLHFDDGWALHIHLLMDGRVRFGGGVDVEEWRRRFELTFDGGPRVVGVDIPLLHRIRVADVARMVDHLGPDLCGHFGPDDLAVAVARIAGAGDDPLSGALLDQRNVAGFGNIYAVEVPFICGVSPHHPVVGVTGLTELVTIGAALIRTNAELGPQNTTGKRLERTEHWVLGERTRSCPRCGTALQRRSGDETPWRRRTAWCPRCQPPPTDADGPASVSSGVVDLGRARKLLALHPARRLLAFEPAGSNETTEGAASGGEPAAGEALRVRYVGPPDPVTPRRGDRRERTGRYRR